MVINLMQRVFIFINVVSLIVMARINTLYSILQPIGSNPCNIHTTHRKATPDRL